MKIVLFLLGQGLFTFALTIRSAFIRRFFFLPIACISLHLTLSPLKTPLPFLANYLFACGHLSNVLIASDYLLLTDVQAELRLRDPTYTPSPLSFYSRLKWAVSLLSSPRGIGWAHEPSKALPPRQRAYPRNDDIRKFTIDQITRLSFYIILALLVGTCNQWEPTIPVKVPPKHSQELFLRPISVLIWAIPVIVFLDGIHRLLTLILVHARYWKPEDWIPLFGSWREAYTIRRFWGRVWHQMLRRFTSSHSAFLVDHIHVGRGTRASFYVQVLTAFFASAVIHATTDWVFISEWRGAFHFFLLQVIAIFIEDIIGSRVGNSFWIAKTTNSGIGYCIGYLWVIFWFTLSVPFWHISFVEK